MKGGPKLSLRPFLYRALQLSLGYGFVAQTLNLYRALPCHPHHNAGFGPSEIEEFMHFPAV